MEPSGMTQDWKQDWADSLIKRKKQSPRAFPFFHRFKFWISYKQDTPYVQCLIHLLCIMYIM